MQTARTTVSSVFNKYHRLIVCTHITPPATVQHLTDSNFYYHYSILGILLCMHVCQLVMFPGGQTERRKQGETQKQFHVVCCLRARIDIFTVYTTCKKHYNTQAPPLCRRASISSNPLCAYNIYTLVHACSPQT